MLVYVCIVQVVAQAEADARGGAAGAAAQRDGRALCGHVV